MPACQTNLDKRLSMTLSVRTLLLFSATSATTLAVLTPTHHPLPAYAALMELCGLLALLIMVCVTFASAADDLWCDPGSTFAAALFGFLGFAAILMVGMLLPAVVP